MTKEEIKILKKVVTEGYKLKAHHSNEKWKDALEAGERLVGEKTDYKGYHKDRVPEIKK